MTVTILAICLAVAVLLDVVLIVRVAVLRNNLVMFSDRLQSIENSLTHKVKPEEK